MQLLKLNAGLLYQLPRIIMLFMLGLSVASIYFAQQWWKAHQNNLAFDNRSLLKHKIQPDNHLQAYSIGYLQAINHEPKLAAQAFTFAEASEIPEIRARAKFALGNLYFALAMKSADIASGGAHQQAVAHIELAREAYKGALRLKPDLYDARFNLELLDRHSPERRTQAWLAETDGVTLQPFKRNGTAMMRDNTRRGLP